MNVVTWLPNPCGEQDCKTKHPSTCQLWLPLIKSLLILDLVYRGPCGHLHNLSPKSCEDSKKKSKILARILSLLRCRKVSFGHRYRQYSTWSSEHPYLIFARLIQPRPKQTWPNFTYDVAIKVLIYWADMSFMFGWFPWGIATSWEGVEKLFIFCWFEPSTLRQLGQFFWWRSDFLLTQCEEMLIFVWDKVYFLLI